MNDMTSKPHQAHTPANVTPLSTKVRRALCCGATCAHADPERCEAIDKSGTALRVFDVLRRHDKQLGAALDEALSKPPSAYPASAPAQE